VRSLSACRVFTLSVPPIPHGVITVDNTGTITDVSDGAADQTETLKAEQHEGILVPGFVNCHCHLEL